MDSLKTGTPPRLLIIGGSGKTGSMVIDEALKRGYKVTALVRNTASIPANNSHLTLIKGLPLNESDIEEAINANNLDIPRAIIVTLASSRASGNPWAAITAPPRLMADVHLNLVAVMKRHDIHKIVTMSSFGTGDSFLNLTFLMRWVIKHSNLGYSYEDHNMVDQEMKESNVNYVLVRPTRLTMGPAAPVKIHGNEGNGVGAMQSVSRASVAAFLLDAVVQDTWDRSTPVIAN